MLSSSGYQVDFIPQNLCQAIGRVFSQNECRNSAWIWRPFNKVGGNDARFELTDCPISVFQFYLENVLTNFDLYFRMAQV